MIYQRTHRNDLKRRFTGIYILSALTIMTAGAPIVKEISLTVKHWKAKIFVAQR